GTHIIGRPSPVVTGEPPVPHDDAFNALVVLGPTAAGKTRLGVQLAAAYSGELVSADSRQVYCGLNIGAGKDLDEYAVDGRAIAYHLIDIVDLEFEFSVFDYQQRFYETFDALQRRGVLPVIVGGTGLYLEAILQGYRMVAAPKDAELRKNLDRLGDAALEQRLHSLKPRLHNLTDLTDRARTIRAIEIAEYTRRYPPPPAPDVRPLILGVRWPRAELHRRIDERLRARLEAGLIEEVQCLLDSGIIQERLHRLGLEYRYVTEFIQGEIKSRNDLRQKLRAAIVNFAKRQETWFRRMERRGARLHWVNRADLEQARAIADTCFLARKFVTEDS
ncbi:MAG: tRNA (adenosine(37)-N6)-dimethylallyltransferase MiaA, partial [Candidatus Hydrogenedentales bacterium]